MRKILLLLALLLPLAASGHPAGKTVPKAKITSIISEFRGYDGVEVVSVGRLGTAALRGVVRAAAKGDPEARQALDLMRGIKRITILEYDDCSPRVRERLDRRLANALDGSELLMEAKDGSSAMRLFGLVDEQTGLVRDFVMHTPGENALICIFGSIPMDTVGKFLSDND